MQFDKNVFAEGKPSRSWTAAERHALILRIAAEIEDLGDLHGMGTSVEVSPRQLQAWGKWIGWLITAPPQTLEGIRGELSRRNPIDAGCARCSDTGVDETGNNDLPCDCPAGATALFNVAGVDGPVTGEEMRKHFFHGCPEPIGWPREGTIPASSLPSRQKK